MLKIIIDTNILVSAFIQKNYPALILKEIVNRDYEICISNSLFEEYKNVLNRDKFKKYSLFKENSDYLLNYIFNNSKIYHPKTKVNIIKDKADNVLLELAEESMADVIITGNFNDFNFTKYKNTLILSPKDFWEKYIIDL